MVSPRYSVTTAAELARNLSAISVTASTLSGFATVASSLIATFLAAGRPRKRRTPRRAARHGAKEKRAPFGASLFWPRPTCAGRPLFAGPWFPDVDRQRRGRPAVFGGTTSIVRD